MFQNFTPKDPLDQDDVFEIDLSPALSNAETIVSGTVTTTPAGQLVVVGTPSFSSDSVTFALSNGIAGTSYSVDVLFTTSRGRTLNRSKIVSVENL